MKKAQKCFAILTCFICVLLSGCSKGNGDNDSKRELTLYCMSNDSKIDQYIVAFRDVYTDIRVNKRKFDDITQMDDLIKSELNAGKGPDIIIFSSQTGLDVLNMAKNGAFASMDDKIKNDDSLDPDDYLPGTFEAGKIDGSQYVLPLTFNVPFIMYDSAAELGFAPSPVITYSQFFDSVSKSMERLKDNKEYGSVAFSNFFAPFKIAAQAVELSVDNQSVKIDPIALNNVIDMVSLLYNQSEKNKDIISLHVKSEIDPPERFLYLYDDTLDITHQIWFYNNLYREAEVEKMGVSIFQQEHNGKVLASADSYGVITKNAGDYAYEFLRIAMDVNPLSGKKAKYGMSLNKKNIESQIETHKNSTSIYQTISMQGLNDDIAELLAQMYGSITEVKIFNPMVTNMCQDAFIPYIEGSKSYEECFKEFEQKLTIYAGE